MLSLIAALIPLIIASAILPTWISLVSLLLDSPNGKTKVLAFNGGVATVRALQLFGAGEVLPDIRGLGLRADLPSWASTLLIIAGAALVVLGVISVRRPVLADAEPPRWFGIFRDAGVIKCGVAGALLNLTSPRQWLLTVSAAALIKASRIGTAGELIALLVYVAGSQALIMMPVLLEMKGDGRGDTIFDRFAGFVTRNSRHIAGAVMLLVGAYLVVRGLT